MRGLFLCLNILVFVYLKQIILKLTELKSEYLTALRAAVEASEKIMEIYLNGFETEFKLDGSPVTQADLAASTIIDSYLETTGIPITSEESIKIDYNIRKEWKESWCVDPLDGTREFVKKNGEFVVNIALISNGVPIFGIIASPINR
ncbi:MAG: 3(2),5-bisphosphate nucleotidase, partial [Bacteroidota bacterium]